MNKKLELEADNEIEPISIVGFPKSGNTWLTRLLADVLDIPVCLGAMRGNAEIATEINRHLSLLTNKKFDVRKEHFRPAILFERVDEVPTRIVYIYRDFRDVVVSSFFYKNRCEETDVRMRSFASLLLRPRALLRHWRCRRRLFKHVEKLSIDGWGETVGTWSQHIAEWHDARTQRSDTKFVFVSYEELLNNTCSTVLRIVHKLNLPRPSDERLQNAVERQSFAALKEHFQKLPDDADVPLGKDFNVKFLRKGASGDWKNFLSPRMEWIIQKHHGEMLFKLGYESDPHWYKNIESDVS